MNSCTLSATATRRGAASCFRPLRAAISLRMLLGQLGACGLMARLPAAEPQADPRDFLMMKLYEGALRAAARYDSKPTAEQLAAMQAASAEASSSFAAMSAATYGCALWLEVVRGTNNTSNVVVTLHNTVPALNYKLWTKTVLMPTQSWTLETNVAGTSGQNSTAVTVTMNGRAQLFFLGAAGGFGTNKSFVGLQYTNSFIGVPDAMGAVGSKHNVQVLNAATGAVGIAAFDRCTGERLQVATNTLFFAVQYGGSNYPVGATFDPRVLFDHEAQRWVATILDGTTRQLMLAISKSDSPLDLLTNWDKYLLPVSVGGSLSDFATLGVDKNGIYISVAQQDPLSATISSNVIVALKKPEIYQGSVISNFFVTHSNELPVSAIFPVVNYDSEPRGGQAWFITKKWPDRTSTNQGGALAYRRMTWSGSNPVWVEANWVEAPNSPVYRDYFDLDKSGVKAPQGSNGLGISLEATGSRLMSAIIQNGDLWTCQHVGLSGTNGHYPGSVGSTNIDRSGIQWVRISTDTNGQFLAITNGRIYDPTNSNPYYYYCPSAAVNQFGDLVAAFSGSRSSEYVRALYHWRSHDGTQSPQPLVLRVGEFNSQFDVWGDYSAASLDPVDKFRIWIVHECIPADAVSDNYWDTWIGEIVPDPPPP